MRKMCVNNDIAGKGGDYRRVTKTTAGYPPTAVGHLPTPGLASTTAGSLFSVFAARDRPAPPSLDCPRCWWMAEDASCLEAVQAFVAAQGMGRHVVLARVAGSRSYNLDLAGSDTDYFGVYVWPAVQAFRVEAAPSQFTAHEPEDVSIVEAGRYALHLLRGNSTALEALCTPALCHFEPCLDELRSPGGLQVLPLPSPVSCAYKVVAGLAPQGVGYAA